MIELPNGLDWDIYGFVTASDYRVQVLKSLNNPKVPSVIAKQTDLEISHVSRSLSELREQELVALLVNEDRRKGRVYGQTSLGTKMVDAMEKYNDD